MARAETVIGLDIGSHSVKAVWASVRRGKVHRKKRALLRLPPDATDKTAIIRPWIEKEGLAKAPCVLGLPGRQAMFQPFLVPPDDPRTLPQVASIEILKFNEMASESMVYGFTPFYVERGERRLLMAMSRPAVLEALLQFARDVGLNVIDIVPTPVALFNALEQRQDGYQTPCIHVNVGHSTSELVVGTPIGPMFARAFTVGGQMFTDALAQAKGLSAAQAEYQKISEGSLTGDDESVTAALQSVADLWVTEMQSCLSMYKNLYPQEPARPRRMILAGGAGRLDGLTDYVAGKLQLDVRSAKSLPVNTSGSDAADFAVAEGLAASGLGLARATISLLPWHVRDELTFRQQKPFWIAAGVTAVLILAASLVGGFRELKRGQKELGIQRAGLSRRQKLVGDIENIEAASRQVQAMAAPVHGLLAGAEHMRDLITLIADSKDDGDWITMVCDAESYFEIGEEAARERDKRASGGRRRRKDLKKRPPPSGKLERVMVQGYTKQRDLSSVKALITDIAAADFVSAADLLSDDRLVPEAEMEEAVRARGIPFIIEVTLVLAGAES